MNLVKITPSSDAPFPLFMFGFRYTESSSPESSDSSEDGVGLQVELLSRPLQKINEFFFVRGVDALLAATSKHVKLAGPYLHHFVKQPA